MISFNYIPSNERATFDGTMTVAANPEGSQFFRGTNSAAVSSSALYNITPDYDYDALIIVEGDADNSPLLITHGKVIEITGGNNYESLLSALNSKADADVVNSIVEQVAAIEQMCENGNNNNGVKKFIVNNNESIPQEAAAGDIVVTNVSEHSETVVYEQEAQVSTPIINVRTLGIETDGIIYYSDVVDPNDSHAMINTVLSANDSSVVLQSCLEFEDYVILYAIGDSRPVMEQVYCGETQCDNGVYTKTINIHSNVQGQNYTFYEKYVEMAESGVITLMPVYKATDSHFVLQDEEYALDSITGTNSLKIIRQSSYTNTNLYDGTSLLNFSKISKVSDINDLPNDIQKGDIVVNSDTNKTDIFTYDIQSYQWFAYGFIGDNVVQNAEPFGFFNERDLVENNALNFLPKLAENTNIVLQSPIAIKENFVLYAYRNNTPDAGIVIPWDSVTNNNGTYTSIINTSSTIEGTYTLAQLLEDDYYDILLCPMYDETDENVTFDLEADPIITLSNSVSGNVTLSIEIDNVDNFVGVYDGSKVIKIEEDSKQNTVGLSDSPIILELPPTMYRVEKRAIHKDLIGKNVIGYKKYSDCSDEHYIELERINLLEDNIDYDIVDYNYLPERQSWNNNTPRYFYVPKFYPDNNSSDFIDSAADSICIVASGNYILNNFNFAANHSVFLLDVDNSGNVLASYPLQNSYVYVANNMVTEDSHNSYFIDKEYFAYIYNNELTTNVACFVYSIKDIPFESGHNYALIVGTWLDDNFDLTEAYFVKEDNSLYIYNNIVDLDDNYTDTSVVSGKSKFIVYNKDESKLEDEYVVHVSHNNTPQQKYNQSNSIYYACDTSDFKYCFLFFEKDGKYYISPNTEVDSSYIQEDFTDYDTLREAIQVKNVFVPISSNNASSSNASLSDDVLDAINRIINTQSDLNFPEKSMILPCSIENLEKYIYDNIDEYGVVNEDDVVQLCTVCIQKSTFSILPMFTSLRTQGKSYYPSYIDDVWCATSNFRPDDFEKLKNVVKDKVPQGSNITALCVYNYRSKGNYNIDSKVLMANEENIDDMYSAEFVKLHPLSDETDGYGDYVHYELLPEEGAIEYDQIRYIQYPYSYRNFDAVWVCATDDDDIEQSFEERKNLYTVYGGVYNTNSVVCTWYVRNIGDISYTTVNNVGYIPHIIKLPEPITSNNTVYYFALVYEESTTHLPCYLVHENDQITVDYDVDFNDIDTNYLATLHKRYGIETLPLNALTDSSQQTVSSHTIKTNVDALSERIEDTIKYADQLTEQKEKEILNKLWRSNNKIDSVYFESDQLLSLVNKASGEAMAKVDVNVNGEIISCYATLKVQGNSSAGLPKKNYTVKFYSDSACSTKKKIDVGWGKYEKYCFKANYIDATHVRNVASANLAAEMVESRPTSDFKTHLADAPNWGQVDGFAIKVFVNGAFHGIYTWNLAKDEYLFGMNSKNNNHIVICSDLHTDCTNFKADWTSENIDDWKIEAGPLKETQIMPKFNDLVDFIVNSTDEQFTENINSHIDLYSVIDYMCYCALAYHPDGISKNALLVSYDGGDTWGMTLYDMDATFLLHWAGDARYLGSTDPFYPIASKGPEIANGSNLLFNRVRECFGEELHDRYFALRSKVLSYANICLKADEIADKISTELKTKEQTKWHGIPCKTENTIDDFKSKVYQRSPIIDRRMALISADPCLETFETLERNEYTASGDDLTNWKLCGDYVFPGSMDQSYTIYFDAVMHSAILQWDHLVTCRSNTSSDNGPNSNVIQVFISPTDANGNLIDSNISSATTGKLYVSNIRLGNYTYGDHIKMLITYNSTTKDRFVYWNGRRYPIPVTNSITLPEESRRLYHQTFVSDYHTYYDLSSANKSNSTYYDYYVGSEYIDDPDDIEAIMERHSANKAPTSIEVYPHGLQLSVNGNSEYGAIFPFGKVPFDANKNLTVSNMESSNQNIVPVLHDGYITVPAYDRTVAPVGNVDFDLTCGGLTRHIEWGFIKEATSNIVNNPNGATLNWGSADKPYVPASWLSQHDDYTIFIQFTYRDGDGTSAGGSSTFVGRNGVQYPDIFTYRYGPDTVTNYNGNEAPCAFTTGINRFSDNNGDLVALNDHDEFSNQTLTNGDVVKIVIRKRGNQLMQCSNFGFSEFEVPNTFGTGRNITFFGYGPNPGGDDGYVTNAQSNVTIELYEGACTKEWALYKCGLTYTDFMYW